MCKKRPLEDRFFEKVKVNKGNGCHEWNGHIIQGGYG
jgi:hypothetical protein